MKQKIAIAADHGGFELKEKIKAAHQDVEWVDIGANTMDPGDDFPDYGFMLAMAVAGNYAPVGIGICGTGVGMGIALNRHPMIRAALAATPDVAKLAREHNDANILVLGGRTTPHDVALTCVETFLNTPFSGVDRYVRRNMKLSLIEEPAGCGKPDCGQGACGSADCASHAHDDHDHDHTSPAGGCGSGGCGCH